jgi:enamine deaminase RidA (YjgF/YER057c/UK114 family)
MIIGGCYVSRLKSQSGRRIRDFGGLSDASELLVAVFGDAGRHARTTIGVASLPDNAAVEVELVAVTRQAQEGAEVE